MLTFPATNAIRSDRTGPQAGLVVHLELPQRTSTGSEAALSTAPDLHRLARAVEDLVRVAAPSVITRVTFEPAPEGAATETEAATHLRPVPDDRADLAEAPAPPEAEPEPDGIDIDVVSRSLRVDGELVELTRREFDLLAYLYGRRSVALSRRELMNAVWQTGYLSGDRTIDVHVRRVRAKLGRHADRLNTLRGFGYRFD